MRRFQARMSGQLATFKRAFPVWLQRLRKFRRGLAHFNLRLEKMIRVVTALLMLTVICSPAVAEVRKSSSIVGGTATKGVSVALQGPQSPVHVGSPIEVTVELRESSHRDDIRRDGTRNANYVFRMVEESSSSPLPLRTLKIFPEISGRGGSLSPGCSDFKDLNLPDYVEIKSPGRYRVTVTLSIYYADAQSRGLLQLQPSNAIEIIVLP
jgi:hypothetical protein